MENVWSRIFVGAVGLFCTSLRGLSHINCEKIPAVKSTSKDGGYIRRAKSKFDYVVHGSWAIPQCIIMENCAMCRGKFTQGDKTEETTVC